MSCVVYRQLTPVLVRDTVRALRMSNARIERAFPPRIVDLHAELQSGALQIVLGRDDQCVRTFQDACALLPDMPGLRAYHEALNAAAHLDADRGARRGRAAGRSEGSDAAALQRTLQLSLLEQQQHVPEAGSAASGASGAAARAPKRAAEVVTAPSFAWTPSALKRPSRRPPPTEPVPRDVAVFIATADSTTSPCHGAVRLQAADAALHGAGAPAFVELAAKHGLTVWNLAALPSAGNFTDNCTALLQILPGGQQIGAAMLASVLAALLWTDCVNCAHRALAFFGESDQALLPQLLRIARHFGDVCQRCGGDGHFASACDAAPVPCCAIAEAEVMVWVNVNQNYTKDKATMLPVRMRR